MRRPQLQYARFSNYLYPLKVPSSRRLRAVMSRCKTVDFYWRTNLGSSVSLRRRPIFLIGSARDDLERIVGQRAL